MSSSITSCAISGKSVAEFPFGADESHSDCVSLKLALKRKIAELNGKGVKHFYCNCEHGVNLWAGEAVIGLRSRLDIRLHIIMPHEEQANLYSNKVRERFFNIHSATDTIRVLSAKNYEGCYRDTDIYMIDRADLLLTDSADSFIAKYAAARGLKIEFLDSKDLRVHNPF